MGSHRIRRYASLGALIAGIGLLAPGVCNLLHRPEVPERVRYFCELESRLKQMPLRSLVSSSHSCAELADYERLLDDSRMQQELADYRALC